MDSTELAWFIAGFTALPVAVLVGGLLVLRKEPDLRAWTPYMCTVVLATIAWVFLVSAQSGRYEPSTDENPNLEIFYSLWQVLSLAGIVIVGVFWTLVGRAAAMERKRLALQEEVRESPR